MTAALRHLGERLVAFDAARPGRAIAEFSIGVPSLPYLADHGFQGMVVVPGSLLIEMARVVERRLCGRAPRVVRALSFESPVVLGAEDVSIRVSVNEGRDGRVLYTFHDVRAGDDRERCAAERCVARLEVDRDAAPPLGDAEIGTEALRAEARMVIGADAFYAALGANANHYGPAFRRVETVWVSEDRCLARLAVARVSAGSAHDRDAGLLDSAVQLLAPFIADARKTLVLRSIDRIDFGAGDCPETLWGRAELSRGDACAVVGDIGLYDGAGVPWCRLHGVELSLLDTVESPPEPIRLVVAANFTADPIEHALNFWGAHFAMPVRVELAPYDQIFQQLLDDESALGTNRDGINVILLNLEKWVTDRAGSLTFDAERANASFGDRARYALPNGLEVVHLNAYETDYLYHEIFEDQCYLKHGIRLDDDATVVDIGANIGLFSLFIASRCRNPTIYAYEPAPDVYPLLQANCAAFGANVRAVNAGVLDRPRMSTLTYYEHSSVFSGFYADETADREAMEAVVRNTLRNVTSSDAEVDEYVSDLTAGRMRRTTHECPMTSVSAIIAEHGIDKIDLLKIDAERSEQAIIKGIDEADWAKIAQIVVEIHDPTYAAVPRIEAELTKRGYECAVERERLLEGAGLFNLYARRPATMSDRQPARDEAASAELRRKVDELGSALAQCAGRTGTPLLLCVCPRTPAARTDTARRRLLDEAERALSSAAEAIPSVHTVDSSTALRQYRLEQYYDPHGHGLGDIPYTPECYAALGTAIFRRLFALRHGPFKVVVLDCDNTLWKGACGELGAEGVELAAPYHKLQQVMLAQAEAGKLLSLCSKNREQDVWDVFERRSDMVLQRDHIVASRIDWNRKSDNIRSIAEELDLGLDSFIVLDDDPVECADIRINCPEAVCLQAPHEPEALTRLLNHCWVFDGRDATSEDRRRTQMYRENADRRAFREQTRSLKDFIAGLELEVDVAPMSEDDLPRVAQLTFRTNQFNFSTARRSEGEIRDFLARPGAHCLVVRVADRFGDYGLVGVVLYEARSARYDVDTFLLSCRVLGRGVEHAVLRELGRRALGEGASRVDLAYVPTERNVPVRRFLNEIGSSCDTEGAATASFAAAALARLEYAPDERQRPPANADGPRAPDGAISRHGLSAALQSIGERLSDIEQLMAAIDAHRLGPEVAELAELAGSRTGSSRDLPLETALLGIWSRVLARRVGLNDNFFDAGGTSLKAVQLIAQIRKELDRHPPIVTLFECPTVSLLADRLQRLPEADGRKAADAAMRRGRGRRRVKRMRTA